MKKYLVGGAIRDNILKLPVTERDWVVVGATPKDMIDKGYQQVGKGFPVFLHPKSHEEYALARTERKSGKGYNGFICHTSPTVTIEDDLRRRDLTINAIAQDDKGNLIDPYNGQYDIHYRCLRHVSDAFSEDPLRILRVARFAARLAHLKFYVAPETLILMQCMTDELSFLPPERIWKETELALATKNPQIYFQILHDCGALKILLPEVDLLFSIAQPVNKKNDTCVHGLITVSMATQISEDIAVRFAALCHDIVKISTLRKLKPKDHDFNATALKILEKLFQRLKVPNSLHALAKIMAQYSDLLSSAEELMPKALIRLFNAIDIWRRPDRLRQIILVSEAIARGQANFKDNKGYKKQGDFLQTAFRVASLVTAHNIITSGFKGVEIGKELSRRRQQALMIWKKTQQSDFNALKERITFNTDRHLN